MATVHNSNNQSIWNTTQCQFNNGNQCRSWHIGQCISNINSKNIWTTKTLSHLHFDGYTMLIWIKSVFISLNVIFLLNFSITNFIWVLGIYGFIFLPFGWTSFRKSPNESDKFEYIRGVVGDYGYVALALLLIMQFATKIGVSGLPHIFVSEVFPFK